MVFTQQQRIQNAQLINLAAGYVIACHTQKELHDMSTSDYADAVKITAQVMKARLATWMSTHE